MKECAPPKASLDLLRRASPAAQFLARAYQPEDWVAILLKNYATGRVVQRVGSVGWARTSRTLSWLLRSNELGFNIYVGVNAIGEGRRTRRRDAIAAVRHVFIDADHDGAGVLRTIGSRSDLPPLSYILQSSPDRIHVFWRVKGFGATQVERLQKLLASQHPSPRQRGCPGS